MKKIIIVVLLATGLNGFAQDSKNIEVNNALKKMTIDLILTVYQQDLVLPILEEQFALKKDSELNTLNAEANLIKIKALSKKLDDILTIEQKGLKKNN